jgi:hypothetical protein
MPRHPKPNYGRGFVFTIHSGHLNVPADAPDRVVQDALVGHLDDMKVRYDASKMRSFVCQLERGGNTDRYHLQGYVWYKEKVALTTCKAFVRAGDAPQFAKGSLKKNFEYCTKQETKVSGVDTVVCGNVPTLGQGARKDLAAACALLKEPRGAAKAMEQFPEQYIRYCNGMKQIAAYHAAQRIPYMRQITVVVLHGDPNGGKSYAAFQSDAEDQIYPMPFSQGKSTWFDNYTGERTLLFEDYRGHIPFGEFLRLLDGYKLQVPSKGSYVPAAWTRIIITTNIHPEQWYRSVNARGMEQNRWANSADPRVGPLERRIHEMWHVSGEWDKAPVWTQVKPDPLDDADFLSDFVAAIPDTPSSLSPASPRDLGERPAHFRRDNHYELCLYCGKETGMAYCDQVCMDADLAEIAEGIRNPDVVA